jgi:hypothetical protein
MLAAPRTAANTVAVTICPVDAEKAPSNLALVAERIVAEALF